MDIQQNMKLMLCDGDIYSWCYDASGNLIFSNCPDQEVLAIAFNTFGCLEKMLSIAQEQNNPAFLSTDMGLVWGAAFERHDDTLYRCHVIGPVFYANVSIDAIYHGATAKYFDVCGSNWFRLFHGVLGRVPTSQHTVFSRNLRMLHYCITGQRIDVSELYVSDIQAIPGERKHTTRDRHRVWQAENAMLQMVRLGDLNYKDALNASMMISDGIAISTRDPVAQAKISCIIFCSIVCRAAIEGGLTPEAGYSLGDAYIQSAVDAKTIDDISTICATMYDDFIRRVHRMRENPDYSKPIQRCCNYIEMNLNRNIRAQELADMVGYSVTYFTRRFREETGFGISDYVKYARIERARVLLKTTDETIQEISNQLGFTTRSYFSSCFRQVTGMTPKEFRDKQ